MKYIICFILFLYIANANAADTCDIARHKAVSLNRIGNYIPQCDDDLTYVGKKYKHVQCHHSAYYCFCADTVTGAPTSENFQPKEKVEMEKFCSKKEKIINVLRKNN